MPNTPIPAAAEGMPKITRRSTLFGLAATTALAIASSAAAMPSNIDARLLQLEAEFDAAYSTFDAAADREEEINDLVRCLFPPRPEDLPFPPDLMAAYDAMTMAEFRDTEHPVNVGHREHSRRNAGLRSAWEAQREKVRRRFGLPAARAETEAAMNTLTAIAHEAIHTPVSRASDILIKLKINERWDLESDVVLEAITADIKALSECEGVI